MAKRRLGLAALGALSFIGCGEDETLVLGEPGPALQVVARSDGRVDFRQRTGAVILRAGWAEALVEVNGDAITVDTRSCGGWTAEDTPPAAAGYFQSVTGAHLECQAEGIGLDWRVWHDAAHDTAVIRLDVANRTESQVRVLRVTPRGSS
ncbi:MAG: hypothetical protein R3B13_30545 [Polyangiaceae bacterium]